MSDDFLEPGELPEWRCPNMTMVAIAELTLGKLGSEIDLGGENNFSS